MLNLPQSTYYGKKIPKEKFYAKLDISSAMKRCFVDEIDQILWQNKLAASTLNVSVGENVIEIDVLEVSLKKKECTYSVFDFLDKNLPNHTIFLITFDNKVQILINYKEAIENKIGKNKITANYKTEWIATNQIQLSIEGLNLDQVYENLVFQIAGQRVAKVEGVDLKVAVEISQQIEKTKKKIAELEVKKRNEKQFNIQLKISNQIKQLMKNLLDFSQTK